MLAPRVAPRVAPATANNQLDKCGHKSVGKKTMQSIRLSHSVPRPSLDPRVRNATGPVSHLNPSSLQVLRKHPKPAPLPCQPVLRGPWLMTVKQNMKKKTNQNPSFELLRRKPVDAVKSNNLRYKLSTSQFRQSYSNSASGET